MPMLSKRGEVEFEIGGELRRFKFNSAAIAFVEEKAGLGISEVLNEEKIGIRTIGMLLQAGGRPFDKGLTLAEVYEWLDDADDLASVMEAIAPALEEGMPGGKKRYLDRKAREANPNSDEQKDDAINSLTAKAS